MTRLMRHTRSTRIGLVALVSTVVLVLALSVSVSGMQGQPAPAQDGFVPMEQVPPEDQLPAAPLLIAAYSLVWVLTLGYIWSIWRRLGTVERDIEELSRRVGEQ